MLLSELISENKTCWKKLGYPRKPTYDVNNGEYSEEHYVDSEHDDDPAEADKKIARDYMWSGSE